MNQTIHLRKGKTKCGYDLDSFDRFGDDLCELLLSYLSVEEKIIYECVSKQWKQLIFNKQEILEIHPIERDNELSRKLSLLSFSNYEIVLNNLLKKFNLINEFKYWNLTFNVSNATTDNSSYYKNVFNNFWEKFKFIYETKLLKRRFNVFNVITDSFLNLRIISFVGIIDDKDLNEFGLKFGQRLKSINFEDINDKQMKTLLRSTINLKTIHINHNIKALIEPNLPKLEEIIISRLFNSDSFELFTDKYYKQIKKVSFNIDFIPFCSKDLQNILLQISRYVNLEELNLELKGLSGNEISEELKIIGQNCGKLKRMKCFIDSYRLKGKLFEIIGQFTALEKLSIFYQYGYIERTGKLNALNSCKKLKRLKLQIDYITDEQFEGIESSLLCLEYISIKGFYTNITDSTLQMLSKLKNLSKLVIFSYKISDSGITHFIENSPQIKVLHFNSFSRSVTALKQAIEKLTNKAKNDPNTHYKLLVPQCQRYEHVPDSVKILRNLMIKKYYEKNYTNYQRT